MSKSPSPRALQELMMAVDAGHAVDDVNVDDSASSDSRKLLDPRRRRSTSTYYGRKSAPAGAVVVEASSEASFEFSTAVVSYSSASPASMVFSDGQLRAHQFPAVRSSAASRGGSRSQATSPLQQSSSVRSRYNNSTNKQRAGVTGSKKRVSFATDGADRAAAAAAATGKAGGGLGKKSGGLLGCMGSACRTSSRNEAVEPVARNNNNLKVVAF
ncbi:hypothetical protein BDA96_01G194700 [Sorghum bicolor]|jgi:hypothetical protein|uniref:Uncharacterized protein n=2 Tax=Sorghum bicolor TaxID=4558 RepID=C5WUC4_SORBI|nr:hypothetical protein SORBI_3001G185300 [Sorghum bicolor]KAG0548755.1 hypothetical protein BDA96_01G194700 [Sorghum bicolor]